MSRHTFELMNTRNGVGGVLPLVSYYVDNCEPCFLPNVPVMSAQT